MLEFYNNFNANKSYWQVRETSSSLIIAQAEEIPRITIKGAVAVWAVVPSR